MICKMPVWYWEKGLHDAIIKNITLCPLNYDYTQKNPIRNYLSIEMDSGHALFDSSIVEIKLFNAQILSEKNSYCNYWWVKDTLDMINGKYILQIDVESAKGKNTIIIKFENAEVVRK